MFSSATGEWATPQDFYDRLNKEFHFGLDAAATAENAKCGSFFTEADDGLTKPWTPFTTFVNPPYGRNKTGPWVHKAFEESQRGALVVMLLAARTDTRWFHKWILGHAEIRFLPGRLKFGGCKDSAPFPSMVVIFLPKASRPSTN